MDPNPLSGETGNENKDRVASSQPVLNADTVSGPKGIRTYETDVAEAIKGHQTSMADMILAEKRRTPDAIDFSPAEKRSRRPLILIAVAFVVLIILGSAASVFLSSGSVGPITLPGKQDSVEPWSFIVVDDVKEVLIPADTGGRRTLLLKAVAEERARDLTLGSIRQVFFTGTEDASTTSPHLLVPAPAFLTVFEIPVPDTLSRAVRNDFMFGFHASARMEPFLVLKTDYYEGAFAGMLAWEETIEHDLADVVSDQPDLPVPGTAPDSELRFEDEILKNRDARVLRGNDGSIKLLYAFLDRETIVITTNESTFKELIDRFSAARFEN